MSKYYGRRRFEEARALEELLAKSFEYLNMNFHKFKPEKRLLVALELVKKRAQIPITIDQSQHKHFTNVQLTDKSEEELVLNLLGRANHGLERKPDPANADQAEL